MDQGSAIAQLILEYRYWILIPLTFLEGPIVAFIAGTLAAVGYFNVYVLAAIFLARDVIVDLAMYAIGYYGGKTAFVHRMLHRFGVTEKELKDIRIMWNKNAGKTMFFSKLSYGVAAAFVMVAGMVEMPLKKFTSYAFIIAVLHYGVLLFLGYYLGASVGGSVAKVLENIQYVGGGAILVITAYILFKRWINARRKKEEEKIEREKADISA
jgi:membrane protein DedA with SNARE-associated domain